MKFAIFFKLKPETVRAAMENPSDRAAVVGGLLEAVGGSLDAYYWMFGEHDGLVIADVPDSTTAATVSLAVSSSGAFASVATHELIPADQIGQLLERAKAAAGRYSPPGA